MKRRTKLFLAVGLLIAALCLTACSSQWDPPYKELDKDGYNVSIRFDANGGIFASRNGVQVVDYYQQSGAATLSDGSKGIYLLSPEDRRRGDGAFGIARNGYFLAGWYTERNPRVNEKGEPLDDHGIPTSQSGKEQGYTYSGLWNFDTDALKLESGKTYSAESPALTLYAAWIPTFTYEFHILTDSGSTVIGSTQAIDLQLPQWNEKTGKQDLNSFPKRDGFTFESAKLDLEVNEALTESIRGADFVDYETGTTTTATVPVYTFWQEGTWFRIHTPEQLLSNARPDGCYMLCADLDFSKSTWPPVFAKNKFNGVIVGAGHTVSGINLQQADNSQLMGGLFGALDENAIIHDVTFADVTYTISAGSRMQGAAFGLLAGSVSSTADIAGVSVSGKLLISENCYPQESYVIGLLCGSGNIPGVQSDITCGIAEGSSDKIAIEVDPNGSVSLTFLK